MIALLSLALLAFTVEQGTLIWAIISAVVVIATFLYIVGHDIFLKVAARKRRRQLKEPCEIHFWIPRTAQGILSYVHQDGEEHRADVLVLPSDSEIQVGLWIKPKLPFRASSWYFGFEGLLQEKPEPIRYYNPLIYTGIAKENSPSQDRTHFIDIHRYYHIVEDLVRVPSEEYVSGFIVRTHKPGTFTAQVLFHGDVVGLLKLGVKVEQPLLSKTVCLQHQMCSLEPKTPASQSGPR